MPEINMPRLSDTMEEGTITRWLKKPGDTVNKGDVLGEIETDKATMDLEAYDAGVLEQLLVQEGETVPIGQPIAVIGSGKEAAETGKQEQPAAEAETDKQEQPAAEAQQEQPAAEAETDKQEQPTAAQSNPPKAQETQKGQAAPAASTQSQAPTTQGEDSETRARSDGAPVRSSPLARRMAEEYGIDLSQIRGTGPGGRIERDDIEDYREQQTTAPTQEPAAAASPAPAAPAKAPSQPTEEAAPAPAQQPTAPPETEVIQFSRVQTLIARRLTEAKQSIPHFYISSEVDMTEALAMRQTLNDNAGEEAVKVSVNDLIVKACALALEKFPRVNSTFKEGQFFQHKHINVGIAIDIPDGLVVPVTRDTNIKGVRSIARESKALIEKARANKLATADLEGGTFSVSNMGMMDVSDFIAVINPPQTAILAVASTRKQFVPIDDQPVIRDLMSMTLSADHRIIYGAMVARFLQEVKRLLQNPNSLLG